MKISSRKNLILFSCLLSILLLVTVILLKNSGAALVTKLDTDALVEDADLILTGVVTDKVAKHIYEEGGIFTFTTVKVEKVIKGNPGPEVIIKEIGGSAGDITLMADGAPKFSKGENVLAFLRSTEDGFFRVVGLAQGKFSIIKEKESGKNILKRDLSQLDFVGEKPKDSIIYLDDYVSHLEKLR